MEEHPRGIQTLDGMKPGQYVEVHTGSPSGDTKAVKFLRPQNGMAFVVEEHDTVGKLTYTVPKSDILGVYERGEYSA